MSDTDVRNEFLRWVEEEEEREKRHIEWRKEEEERKKKEAIRDEIFKVVGYVEEQLLNNPVFDGGSYIGDATTIKDYLKAYNLMKQTIEDLGEIAFEVGCFKSCFDSVEARVNTHKKCECINTELQPKNDLPKELDNPDIKDLFERTYKRGLMKKEGERYIWNSTKSSLVFFAARTSNFFGMRKHSKHGSNEEKQVYWKPFQDYFNVKGLAKLKFRYDETDSKPTNIKIIDSLFEG